MERSYRDHFVDLLPEDHPFLNIQSEPFDFNENPVELANILFEQMELEGGMGISAIQVGIPLSVFVMREESGLMRSFFNPQITSKSESKIFMPEGCLSFPELFVSIERPETVIIRARNVLNEAFLIAYDGINARCVLHEVDHVNGITMKDRAGKLRWKTALNKRRQDERLCNYRQSVESQTF